MRIALTAVALAALVACGSAPSTTNPLESREPAPTGWDPPSGTTSGSDPAPVNDETPPNPDDPTTCTACSGAYTCDGISVVFSFADGVCTVTASSDGAFSASATAACDGDTVSGMGATFTITNGAASACEDGGCSACTASTAVSIPSADAGASMVSSSCGSLQACCSNLPAVEQPGCNDIVTLGNEETCGSSLTGFQDEGGC